MQGVAGVYLVEVENKIYKAYARGILRQDQKTPVPGDRVLCSDSGDPDYPLVIDQILERRNHFLRPALANLDSLLITAAASKPVPDYLLLDKLALLAAKAKVRPVLLITKLDMARKSIVQDLLRDYLPAGWTIYASCIEAGKDPEFFKYFAGQIIALAGQSGSGKSTFLNCQFGEELMSSGELSAKLGRGKQTTRHSELFRYCDLYLADTPGFQKLAVAKMDLSEEDFELAFPEITLLSQQCQFNDCRHVSEPNCAVRDAVLAASEELNFCQLISKERGFIQFSDQSKLKSPSPERLERFKLLYEEYQLAVNKF